MKSNLETTLNNFVKIEKVPSLRGRCEELLHQLRKYLRLTNPSTTKSKTTAPTHPATDTDTTHTDWPPDWPPATPPLLRTDEMSTSKDHCIRRHCTLWSCRWRAPARFRCPLHWWSHGMALRWRWFSEVCRRGWWTSCWERCRKSASDRRQTLEKCWHRFSYYATNYCKTNVWVVMWLTRNCDASNKMLKYAKLCRLHSSRSIDCTKFYTKHPAHDVCGTIISQHVTPQTLILDIQIQC